MRYDTPVYFQHSQGRIYNPETGNYSKPEPKEEMRFACVQDTGESRMQLIYGEIRQGSLTVQLQNHYDDVFETIRIGGRRYKVDAVRKTRFKHIFTVSEVH